MQAEEMVSGIEQLQFRLITEEGLKHAHEINEDMWHKIYGISIDLLIKSECSEALPRGIEKIYTLSDVQIKSTTRVESLREQVHFEVMLRNL